MQWPCLDMFVVRLRLLTMFDAVWSGVLACKAAHAVWKYGLPQPGLEVIVVRLHLLTMSDAVWLGVLAYQAAHAVWNSMRSAIAWS